VDEFDHDHARIDVLISWCSDPPDSLFDIVI